MDNAMGVLPKEGFYSTAFSNVLGMSPDTSVKQKLLYSKKYTFQPQELVVVQVKDPQGVERVVYGVVGKKLKEKDKEYPIQTAKPDKMWAGYKGFIHHLPAESIGKIPSSFRDALIALEETSKMSA